MYTFVCRGCGKEVEENNYVARKYCNSACRNKYSRKHLIIKRNCAVCGRQFDSFNRAKYCGGHCRRKAHGNLFQTWTKKNGVSTGTVGAASELVVSLDLMLKGYDVFRALSPMCSCDLIAFANGDIYRVEVRTAHRNLFTKKIASARRSGEEEKHDIYAQVIYDEHGKPEIVYEPEVRSVYALKER
ncbi:MAG: PDDEXK-like family protein, partial [Planctomycetota bacterium]